MKKNIDISRVATKLGASEHEVRSKLKEHQDSVQQATAQVVSRVDESSSSFRRFSRLNTMDDVSTLQQQQQSSLQIQKGPENEVLVCVDEHEASPLLRQKTAQTDAKSSTRKSVHFPQNIIRSVEIVHTDDQILLHVEYERPVWTWVCCLVAYFSFAIAWTMISQASHPTETNANNTGLFTPSQCVVLFGAIAFSANAIVISVGVLVSWFPSRFERRLLKRWDIQRNLLGTVLFCAVSRGMLLISLMMVISETNLASFAALPLVFVFIYQCIRHKTNTVIDWIGILLSFGGVAVLFSGEATRGTDEAAEVRWLSLGVVVVGSALEAMFKKAQRQISVQIGHFPVLLSTSVATAIVALAICWVVGGFEAYVGDPSGTGLAYLRGNELSRVIVACITMLVTTVLQQILSNWFDLLGLLAGFSLVAPLSILFFHTLHLPRMTSTLEVVGGALLCGGCVVVFVGSWIHRRRVELPINL